MAVLAQSLAGDGGAVISAYSTGSTSYGATLGGSTGSGDNGGTVNVTANNVNITTNGVNASGIIAQSIGNGGGTFTSTNAQAVGALAGTVNLGSTEGSGHGGPVTVALNSGGQLTTNGANSFGVVAQSIGGGGGFADFASAGSSTGGTVSARLAETSSGGTNNSTPDTVSVTGGGLNIVTTGAQSAGMVAQSIGGGGGVAVLSSPGSSVFSGTVTLGTQAGNAQNGGNVTINDYNIINTYGILSPGIVAQSIANGGGFADLAATSVILRSLQNGSAGTVSVADAYVDTSGAQSPGIVAQSIGGGGGVAVASTSAVLGGAPGGANASTVTVNDQVQVTTQGAQSPGIVAQSIAGGGGLVLGAPSSVLSATFGTGGSPGNPSTVTVTTGLVSTAGDASPAVMAQSIGGGGGVVLSNSPVAQTFGAGTGVGNTVTITVNNQIATSGNGSAGVLAQSIGGGGGASVTSYNNSNPYYGTNIGGSTGTGDSGGTVNLTAGNISVTTQGANAPGLVAQSVGNGGGTLSATNTASNGSVLVTTTLGSNRGGGNAGTVNVTLGSGGTTTINTAGVNSIGLLAQSVGGGGGFEAIADTASSATSGSLSGQMGQDGGGGSGVDVTVTGTANITTTGAQAPGAVIQSITGGGGVLAVAGAPGTVYGSSFRMGATSGYSNYDGTVTATLSGSVTTSGTFSPGVVAQSIAGGGGVALVNTSAVTLGGTVNSTSYPVNVTTNGAIVTNGAASPGIVAQSIGGGGGLVQSSGAVTFYSAPGGANASNVSVTNYGAITTYGVNSIGILAQSIGGGGGSVLSNGSAVSYSFIGKNKTNGGSVTVNVDAPIVTYGAGSYGVVAQAVAGGGGLVTNGTAVKLVESGAGGSVGSMNVYANSSITTHGNGSSAAYLHSSTDPLLVVAPGVVLTGGAGGSAVIFESPLNELDNSGTLQTFDGATGLAISSLLGDTTVNNGGALLGSVGLAAGRQQPAAQPVRWHDPGRAVARPGRHRRAAE